MERLNWGLSNEVPENARAAWGCRAIARRRLERIERRTGGKRWVDWSASASVDIPPDRKDFVGSDKDRAELRRWLEENMEGAWEVAKELIVTCKAKPDKSETFVLMEDEKAKAICNTNASHGYLYVAVWLKGDA